MAFFYVLAAKKRIEYGIHFSQKNKQHKESQKKKRGISLLEKRKK
jgi:hypothetical protein